MNKFTELVEARYTLDAALCAPDFWPKGKVEAADLAVKKFIEAMPSGGGFDDLPKFLSVGGNRIRLRVPYHCMDEYGYYCGWGYFYVDIEPSFTVGWDVNIEPREGDNEECDAIVGDSVLYFYDTYCNAIEKWLKS